MSKYEDPYLLFDSGLKSEFGDGEATDLEKAKWFYARAAATGHSESCVRLGGMIERAATSSAEVARARELYGQAACAGDTDGLFHLGRLLLDLDECKEALRHLRRAAAQGSDWACVWIAIAVEEGKGSTQDVEAAIRTYRQHSMSVPQAAVRLAQCYHTGTGVERDTKKARAIYQRLADAGESQGWYGLGMIQSDEDETRGDGLDHSIEFFLRAANDGLAVASEYCGDYYTYGWGGAREHEKALPFLERAAAFGLAGAICTLGTAILQGWGMDRDPLRAIPLLLAAAERGESQAMTMLGQIYFRGDGVSADAATAERWCQRAVRAGCQLAPNLLREWGLS